MNLDALDISILGPAFVAGLLVLATHVPLGREVLGRGIIFIDLAVAQIAGIGVIAAHTFGWGDHPLYVQLAALVAAASGAMLLTFSERILPDVQEAIIGVSFVLAATLSILLLANNPHGGEELKDLLVGQILWVTTDQLWPIALVYAGVLAAWFSLRSRLGHAGFYLLFAVVVTMSVQLVGVYLVFTSLIVPALAVRKLPERSALPAAWAIGVVGYAVGLVASAVFDLPTGAMIVWALAAAAAIMGSIIGSIRRPGAALP